MTMKVATHNGIAIYKEQGVYFAFLPVIGRINSFEIDDLKGQIDSSIES